MNERKKGKVSEYRLPGKKKNKGEQFQNGEVCKAVIFPATDLVIEVILEDSDV